MKAMYYLFSDSPRIVCSMWFQLCLSRSVAIGTALTVQICGLPKVTVSGEKYSCRILLCKFSMQ